METRSRKRSQAVEQPQSPPNREKKKSHISLPSLATPTPQHRYPTRRLSQAPIETSEAHPDSPMPSRSRKKLAADNLINQDTAQQPDNIHQTVENMPKRSDRVKRKEKQSEVKDKGKEKEVAPYRDDVNPQNMQVNSKIEKSRQMYLGGSYSAPSLETLMQILSSLTSGDEAWQMVGLTQLCEVLCMGNENTLSHFPSRSFVTELVKILNMDYNPELMLLAARALTQLCDALPASCNLLVSQGAVPYFCRILQSIQYIDVAEQSLQALFKISREHPGPCLQAGGLNAVLSNFEFYSTGVQRVAVSTAANMCRRMPADAFNFVNEVLPILTNLLQYPDTKVVEHASVCLIRVAESFATSWEKLDILCMHGLIPETVRLLSADHAGEDVAPQTSLSSSTYTGLVRLLSICANGSSVAAESLLELNISSILRDILTDSGSTSSQSISTVVMNMPSEQLCEIVTLINVLLPRMPQPLVPASHLQIESARLLNSITAAARKQPLCDKPNLLSQFGADLFPVLVQVYGTSLNLTVRATCLDAIRKLAHFSTADMLRPIFQDLNISSFMVGVLASKDPTAQITALQIGELLMQKLPDYFAKMFIKEGVLHTINIQFGLDLANSTSIDRSRRRSKVSNTPDELENVNVENSVHENDGRVAPSEDPKKDLRSMAINLAQNFRDTYFHSNSGISETVVLKKLKSLCSTLSGDAKTKVKRSGDAKTKVKHSAAAPANDEIMAAVLVEILMELGKGNNVSTFEFVGCGVIESLLYYFSCGNLQNEKLSPAELRQRAFERLQQFFSIAMSLNNQSTEPFLVTIVRKLQSALASLESFPVKLTRPPAGNSSGSRTMGLNTLAQPLKLQFFRNPGEKNLRDFPPTILLVSPLTTLASVEHYLWPHVRNSDATLITASPSTSAPAGIDSRPLTRSKLNAPVASERSDEAVNPVDLHAKAASKSKGKEKVDQIMERKGPETRSIAEKRRQATTIKFEALTEVEDEDAEFYQSEGSFTSDDDEYYSDEERDEQGQVRLVSEEESTLCNVYEIVLGDNMSWKGALLADKRAVKRATGSTSASVRVVEDGIEGFVVVPGASSLSEPARLCFSLCGKVCDRSWTILRAIQHMVVASETDDKRFTSLHHEKWIWDKLHIFDYQQALPGMSSETSSSNASLLQCGTRPESVSHQTILLDSVMQRQLPCDLKESSPTYNVLLLLYILEGFQKLSGQDRAAPGLPIPIEEFLNSKLTPKLSRQMQDGLALCSGNLPAWCHQLTQACPFLFSFESRRQYFHLTAFGLPRALHRLQQQQIVNNMASSNERESQITRLRRRKVRISRDHIFESAMKVMDLFSDDKGVLEVEYFGEVGTGLGPTLEFYTLLSQELQKASLGMWRITEQMNDDSEGNNDVVYTSCGLFPRPWHPSSQNHVTVLNHFRLLGQVVGKALQDGRLLDLPLSKAFYKLMLKQELDLYDVKSIGFQLGNNLEQMHKLINKKGDAKTSKRSTKENRRSLRLHNTKIEELYLNFTLPGYPDFVLKPGGENIMVESQNLEEYVALVVDASVKSGILPQMDAFCEGFNQIFPISTLQIFNEEELSYMLCGLCEMWQPETLVEHLRFDHGYNASSPPIKYLLEIMGEFNPEQQRAFLQFVTGAPQLPCGGLSALRPKLTIVRKLPSRASGETSPGSYALFVDGDLPSVMTCANYLKLPPYSCKEVMLERLLYAIHEGQGSFDLS